MSPEVVIIGSGPNGLAAAITMARAGYSVEVREQAAEPGGGMRSEELTLPGFIHDVCSAAHPLGAASPFFRSLPLGEHGLRWVESPAAIAQPLPDGPAVLLQRSVEETAETLGRDAKAYLSLMKPLVHHADELFEEVLSPMLHIPRHPRILGILAGFGARAFLPVTAFGRVFFRDEPARALLGGIAAHANIPLEWAGTTALSLVLGAAGHHVGWPLAEGGSRSIARALVSYLKALGGEVKTGARVESLREVEGARWVFCDVTPRQFLALAGDRLPERYQRKMLRYRYGPGVFKVDWALAGSVPWRDSRCMRAATVHVGGTLAQMAASERAPVDGTVTERPFVLVVQPALFDPSRAPEGRQTLWGYCHVPHGFNGDLVARIEAQIERFAPGFRGRILARHVLTPADLERRNPNLVGGDISGGSGRLRQLIFRPVLSPNPYQTPLPGVFLCSSSTPPGPGVHGMCGYHAARFALRASGTMEYVVQSPVKNSLMRG